MTENGRLPTAMPRIIAAVHELATELEVTNEELLAALGFLAEVGRADEMVLLSDVMGLSRVVDDQTHAASAGTPSNVLGPFYRPGSPLIGNPGSIVRGSDPGLRATLRGVVTSATSGAVLAGATVDIWQANAEGMYSNEVSTSDPWHLRGRQRTDSGGRYEITTVIPLHYTVKHDGPVGRLLSSLERHPWRPAHIHLLVSAERHRTLVTQVYIAGGPYLDDDTIDGVKGELVVPVVDDALSFDVVLQQES